MADRFTFERFIEAVENKVKEELGCRYNVSIIKVIKNNNLCLQGLTIRINGCNVAPTIYLNDFYKDYIDGRGFDDIVQNVLKVYKNFDKDMLPVNNSFNWYYIKDHVILRLVNYDLNKETFIKEKVPHKVVFDNLAVTFNVLVGISKAGIQSFRINKQIFDDLVVDINTIYVSALLNTQKYFKPTIRNMHEIIASMLAPAGMDDDEYAELFDKISPNEGRGEMFVLSNESGIYGATALLYPDIIKEFAETMNTDLYILPSSIHEVILLLDYGREYSNNKLKEMVKEVNISQVPEEDILGDNVYMYKRSIDKIIMI